MASIGACQLGLSGNCPSSYSSLSQLVARRDVENPQVFGAAVWADHPGDHVLQSRPRRSPVPRQSGDKTEVTVQFADVDPGQQVKMPAEARRRPCIGRPRSSSAIWPRPAVTENVMAMVSAPACRSRSAAVAASPGCRHDVPVGETHALQASCVVGRPGATGSSAKTPISPAKAAIVLIAPRRPSSGASSRDYPTAHGEVSIEHRHAR